MPKTLTLLCDSCLKGIGLHETIFVVDEAKYTAIEKLQDTAIPELDYGDYSLVFHKECWTSVWVALSS